MRNLKLNSNSKLVTRQMNNEYEVKEDRMKRYLAVTNQLISNFDDVKITQVLEKKILKPFKALGTSLPGVI